MKRAGYETDFVHSENGLVGILLDADFTSEHEWGIKSLLQSFGISRKEDEFGVEPRRAKAVEEQNFFFHREDNRAVLAGGSAYTLRYMYQEIQKEGLKKAPNNYSVNEKTQIAAAWDSGSFMVYVESKEGSNNLEAIYNAFLENDVLIMLGGGWEAFKNAGLVLGIISKIPDDLKKAMYDADESNYKLKQTAKATGIYDVVPFSKYFALSPRWLGEFKLTDEQGNPRTTKYDVIFWLNPYNQDENGFGWFTVEELTAWINGEAPDGPISNRGNNYRRQQRINAILRGEIKGNLYSDERFCSKCEKIITVGYRWQAGSKMKVCPTCNESLIQPAK